MLLIAPAAEPSVTEDDRRFVAEVAARLLAVIERPAGYDGWPPAFDVDDSGVANAYAALDTPQGPDRKVPRITVTKGEIEKVAHYDPDRLALTLGHELGHVVLGHVLSGKTGATRFQRNVFTREQELAADRFGMDTALRAGFSYRLAIASLVDTMRHSLPYSSYEGLSVDHPSWKERAALLDTDRAGLWHAMAAFDNGVFFLSSEQYLGAAVCFRRVIDEFPDSYEAWADLGYAWLMDYADRLDTDQLARLGIGPVVTGSFYQKARTLDEQITRGEVPRSALEVWDQAVDALQTALRLQPETQLARANLGLAMLLRPDARGGPDFAAAARLLGAAAEPPGGFGRDALLPLILGNNRAVAELAAGDVEHSAESLRVTHAAFAQLADGAHRSSAARSLADALLYNQALSLSRSGRGENSARAATLFGRYLQQAPRASGWWPLALAHYRRLMAANGASAEEPRAAAVADPRWRLVTSVRLRASVMITLSDPVEELIRDLGQPDTQIPVDARSGLRRLHYGRDGADLLVNHQVLAILLHGPAAPGIVLQGGGPAASTRALRPGLAVAELEAVLGTDYTWEQLESGGDAYRFYPSPGVGVRIRKGIVDELIVAPARLPTRG